MCSIHTAPKFTNQDRMHETVFWPVAWSNAMYALCKCLIEAGITLETCHLYTSDVAHEGVGRALGALARIANSQHTDMNTSTPH